MMATITKTICDKCKREHDEHAHIVVSNVEFDFYFMSEVKFYDLCKKCESEIQNAILEILKLGN